MPRRVCGKLENPFLWQICTIREEQLLWMADTFVDLPKGQDQEIPIIALRFTWLSPYQTENDLLGGLSHDTQHHYYLTQQVPRHVCETTDRGPLHFWGVALCPLS